MDDHYTFEDYPGFVALLPRLCKKKRSGMLFAATNANQMARIELQHGEISDVSFMHKRGSVALSLLTRVQGRAGAIFRGCTQRVECAARTVA
jgi:hypothetical protein